jgi:hypothetical protein
MKPWAGRCSWIWYERQIGDVDGNGLITVDDAIALAKRYGMRGLFIKESDEGRLWWQTDESELARYREEGIAISAWTYAYGSNPAAAAAAIIELASRFDGVIIDAESELRNAEGVDRSRTEIIDGILGPVRAAIGWDYPLAVAPLPVMQYHGDLNYARWRDWGCDYIPQFYTNVLPAKFDAETLFEEWAAKFDMGTVYPAFGAYGDTGYSGDAGAHYPTIAEFDQFEDLAAAYGCPGVSYWRIDTINPGTWIFGDAPYAGMPKEDDVSDEAIAAIQAELINLVALAGGQEAAGDAGAGAAIRTAVNNIIAAEPRFGLEG